MANLMCAHEADGTVIAVGFFDKAQAETIYAGKTVTDLGNVKIPDDFVWAGTPKTANYKVSGEALVGV